MLKMYERFNENAKEAMKLAEQDARNQEEEYVGLHHIFLGILKANGTGHQAISNFEIDVGGLIKRMEDIYSKDEFHEPKELSGMTLNTRRALELAEKYSQELNNDFVGTGHILYVLLGEKYGAAATLLEDCTCYKTNRDMIRNELTSLLKTGKSSLPSKILSKDGDPYPKTS